MILNTSKLNKIFGYRKIFFCYCLEKNSASNESEQLAVNEVSVSENGARLKDMIHAKAIQIVIHLAICIYLTSQTPNIYDLAQSKTPYVLNNASHLQTYLAAQGSVLRFY